jgi:RNA polymerase sigma-70 factor (ECF subfamily)
VEGIGLSAGVKGIGVTFEEFYRREFPRVYRAAWFLARHDHDALEATQEAFARAFARWRRLGGQEWVAGWVMTTALNLLRRRRREVPVAEPMETDAAAPTSNAVDLQRALHLLPRRQREALVLFYVGDLSVHAVATLMRVSEGTVKAHLSRGRQTLRDGLEIRHD